MSRGSRIITRFAVPNERPTMDRITMVSNVASVNVLTSVRREKDSGADEAWNFFSHLGYASANRNTFDGVHLVDRKMGWCSSSTRCVEFWKNDSRNRRYEKPFCGRHRRTFAEISLATSECATPHPCALQQRGNRVLMSAPSMEENVHAKRASGVMEKKKKSRLYVYAFMYTLSSNTHTGDARMRSRKNSAKGKNRFTMPRHIVYRMRWPRRISKERTCFHASTYTYDYYNMGNCCIVRNFRINLYALIIYA